jgi:carbon-monoxide dehydrogenase large subunit
VPQRNIALGPLAALANPLRGAVQPGTEPGPEATAYFGPAKGATAAGAHVEIDPATMALRILKYVVAHDCGTVINPLIVAGQIEGGVAQAIGNAFYERLAFDEQGQLINGTLADHLLPTAPEVPRIEILHHVTPSPYKISESLLSTAQIRR